MVILIHLVQLALEYITSFTRTQSFIAGHRRT